MTNDLFANDNACADFEGAKTYKERVKAAALFCAERHSVYVKKSKGLPPPWTMDPVMRSYRFCNIYRELDKVTEWIMGNWIKPNLDNENIMCLALTGRLINHPDTLQLMIDEGFDFKRKPNTERLFKLFDKIRQTPNTQLVTGAYIVNTIFPKGFEKINGSKADYLANFFIPAVWELRKDLRAGLDTGSFSAVVDAFKQVHGIGAFIGNQAAVDLSYTPLLSKAKDIDTTWNPGPGTIKGIRWVTNDWSLAPGSDATNEALSQYLEDLNSVIAKFESYNPDRSKLKTNLVPLSGPNASNSLCELAKIVWMATGRRERLKNRYPGAH